MCTYQEFYKLLRSRTDEDLIQQDRQSEVYRGVYHGLQLHFSQVNESPTTEEFVETGVKALTLGYPYYVWCDRFTEGGYQLIVAGLLHGINVATFASASYDDKQMLQIYLGELHGIDTSSYASVNYSYEKMYTYRQLIEKGVDITSFLDSNYTYFHLDTIADCCNYGVDITALLDPNLPQEEVIQISNKLIATKWDN